MMNKSEQMRAFCREHQTLPKGAPLDAIVDWFNGIERMKSKTFLGMQGDKCVWSEEDWEDITVAEAERALLLWDGK